MKKTKLTRSLMAACSIVALSVVLSGCLHSDDDPVAAAPEPDPPVVEPDPGPTDLDDTQAAAEAAADDAMAAADEAAGDSDDATEATATLATLQTGADSNSKEMGGN